MPSHLEISCSATSTTKICYLPKRSPWQPQLLFPLAANSRGWSHPRASFVYGIVSLAQMGKCCTQLGYLLCHIKTDVGALYSTWMGKFTSSILSKPKWKKGGHEGNWNEWPQFLSLLRPMGHPMSHSLYFRWLVGELQDLKEDERTIRDPAPGLWSPSRL